ncbi:MAG: tetraacyldisaccharide 4'-kinase [Alphaproteobacteria bacterium]|nr:tetraacyldisaccharide 4'-kinase [Alphaproteobacteria bacterium]
MGTPAFWDKKSSWISKMLMPLGVCYAWSVARRFKRAKPYQAPVPVICVGNISVGGTGKTPVCLALMKILKQEGFFFLNHGYKSKVKNVLVDVSTHTPFEVGDEAMMLAEMAPTVVDNHRARGAQLAVKCGAKGIIMDDGFQNPSLIKTLSFVVVDGKKGFANECVLPAGPLREPALRGLKRADAVIIVGEDTWGVQFYLQRYKVDLPVLTGRFVPNIETLAELRGKQVFAFAGLGNPNKFFDTLCEAGVEVVGTQSFPDHYFYTRFDIEEMKQKAGAIPLITTTKDAIKLSEELGRNVKVLSGEFIFDDPAELHAVLKEVLK